MKKEVKDKKCQKLTDLLGRGNDLTIFGISEKSFRMGTFCNFFVTSGHCLDHWSKDKELSR